MHKRVSLTSNRGCSEFHFSLQKPPADKKKFTKYVFSYFLVCIVCPDPFMFGNWPDFVLARRSLSFKEPFKEKISLPIQRKALFLSLLCEISSFVQTGWTQISLAPRNRTKWICLDKASAFTPAQRLKFDECDVKRAVAHSQREVWNKCWHV